MEKENEVKKGMTPEEVEKVLRRAKGIWGIEGMDLTPEEERIARAFLLGEISVEEYRAQFLKV